MAQAIDYHPTATAPPWGTIIPSTPEVCPHCGSRLRWHDPPATITTFKLTFTPPVPAMRADEI